VIWGIAADFRSGPNSAMSRRDMMIFRSKSRIAATCAIAGSLLVFVGTYLHPMDADPNDALAAFAEYAADRLWVMSHLTQFAGVVLAIAALLFLTQQLEAKSGARWARIATGGAIASLAVAAAVQAVDGIALKTLVDAWAAAPAAQKETAFYAAFAVRQVEIGLAAVLSLLLGLTVTLFGAALLVDSTYPQWLSGLAIVGGVPTMVAGVAMAFTGFSPLAMAINLPAGCLVLVWMLALGVGMWRRGRVPPEDTAG
jgi:hypothetical protein